MSPGSSFRRAFAPSSVVALSALFILGCGTLFSLEDDPPETPPPPDEAGATASDGSQDGDSKTSGGGPDGAVDADKPIVLPSGKVVFVTDGRYDGALGSLTGADGICQTEATNAGVKRSFQAYLTTTRSGDPGLRIGSSVTGWSRPDGVLAFDTGKQMGNPHVPLDVTIKGRTIDRGEGAWTGLTSVSTADDCGGWKSKVGSSQGGFGEPSSTMGDWRANPGSILNCDTAHHLYCFEK